MSNLVIDPDLILHAVSFVILVVQLDGTILYVNSAGEQLFKSSASALCGTNIAQILPDDSSIICLIKQARKTGNAVYEYHVPISNPRIGHNIVNIQVSPIPERDDALVISLQERSLAAKIDRQLTHREAARSVSAMAAMLIHEVKNPLAGIRGAAQLLEQSVTPEDRLLTQVICEETDRVCTLVNRVEAFSGGAEMKREAVNIHQILVRVRTLAQTSFGRHLTFHENFDPSLPPVDGERDQLVQVFLNLVKNAAEATPHDAGEVQISTAYCHGLRLAMPGNSVRTHLPLMVSIQDNGEGIPPDLKQHLFQPFVTSKSKGSGLGLALVAKIIDDHGGLIEFESEPRRTIFRVMLPMHMPAGETA